MKDHYKDSYTTNSHYLNYTLLFGKVGRMYFLNWGVFNIGGIAIQRLAAGQKTVLFH